MYERVLRYHGPLIYEAKVLKCETWDETSTKLDTVGPHHLVHYKGWKQTCVSDQPAQTLSFPPSDSDSAFTAGMSGSPWHVSNSMRPTSPFRRTSPGCRPPPLRPVPLPRKLPRRLVVHKQEEGGRGTKRGREDDDGTRRPEIAAGHATGTVPDMLKVLLVDDWDAVTKNSQVWFQSRTLCFCVALNRPQCICLSASCSPVHLVLS